MQGPVFMTGDPASKPTAKTQKDGLHAARDGAAATAACMVCVLRLACHNTAHGGWVIKVVPQQTACATSE